jgi:hypothetical protein
MKPIKFPYHFIVLIICCFSFNYGIGQTRDFSKDTLRIKVYTEIEYVEGRMKKVEITKVFCDYCSPFQMEALKEQARSIVYHEKRYWTYRKVNDIHKFTIIIRVSKIDFAALKDQEIKDENKQ